MEPVPVNLDFKTKNINTTNPQIQVQDMVIENTSLKMQVIRLFIFQIYIKN